VPPHTGLFYLEDFEYVSRTFLDNNHLNGREVGYMAKAIKEKDRLAAKRKAKVEIFPLGPTNYKILIAGITVIVVGYILLGTGEWDGFLALTLAPIVLVIGYCIIIPLGIIYRKREKPAETSTASTPTSVPQG
jgi:hypothetical protein